MAIIEADAAPQTPFERDVAATQRYFDSPRFDGIIRLYSARQVVEQRGTIPFDYIVAREAAEAFYPRLRELYAQLLRARRELLPPGDADEISFDERAGWLAVRRGECTLLANFSRAAVIVSFDDDFLSSTDTRNSVWNSREYAASRRVDTNGGRMSRLYVVESTMSATGGMADHRRRMRASELWTLGADRPSRAATAHGGEVHPGLRQRGHGRPPGPRRSLSGVAADASSPRDALARPASCAGLGGVNPALVTHTPPAGGRDPPAGAG